MDGNETRHRASRRRVEDLYCFWSSSVKFQGHTGRKIDDFAPIWAFPDHNVSLKVWMVMQLDTELLEV